MPLSSPRRIGKSFTSARFELSPHYFLRRKAKGFSGEHFLEEGLRVGTDIARARFAALLQAELNKKFNIQPKGRATSAISSRAGISIRVVENVTGLAEIDIKRLLFLAFRDAAEAAKSAADTHFHANFGDSQPQTPKGVRPPTITLYNYKTFSDDIGRGFVGLSVQLKGTLEDKGKVIALNFGLRSSKGDYPNG